MTEEYTPDMAAIAMKLATGEGELSEQDQATFEMMQEKQYFQAPPGSPKEAHRKRKEVRAIVFKIIRKIVQNKVQPGDQAIEVWRANNDIFTLQERALIEMIEPQLDTNRALTWEKFTFTWDVHPVDRTKTCQKEFWTREGGKFDDIGAFFPLAFTEQVID